MNRTNASKHFDALAPLYDTYKSSFNLYYRSLKQAVQDCIKKKSPTILDIGCGTGNILASLHPKKGLGVDISSKMIQQAKRKYGYLKTLSFRKHDIEKQSMQGNFDYILFNDVIEHVENQDIALKNISLSMKKNTILILSMANPKWEPILILLEKLKLKMPEGPHYRISEKQLLQLLHKHCLVVISKNVYIPHTSISFLNNFGLMYVYTIKKLS